MSHITAYEAERNARIAANKKRMLELNLPEVRGQPHHAVTFYLRKD